MKSLAVCGAAMGLLAATLAVPAQTAPTPQELQTQIQALQQQMQQMAAQYQEQIRALQKQVDDLKAGQEAAGAQVQPARGLLPPAPAAPPAANLSNPAVSLIPDFTYSAGNDPFWKDADAFNVREVEVAFSAAIDPHANAFAALSLEDGHLSAEEAYASFPGLPGGFTLKVGKFYADFGKTNQMHTHAWLQADKPLALRTMLGEEPFADAGFSVSHLLPTPWMSDLTLEVTGGRNDTVYGGRRGDLSYLLAWRSFWDLSEASNLEAQVSLAAGKNATGRGTGLGNLSVTYRHKPPGDRLASFLWRTEVIGEGYRTPDGLNRSTGAFSYVDWQFARGWFLGARADYAEHPLDPALHDRGGALLLTYFPSEYQKFRLQVERVSYAGIGNRNALVFEYGFAIGPHGAHPF